MGGKAGTTTGLALLLAAGMTWAGGVPSGEGNRGLSPIIFVRTMGVCFPTPNEFYSLENVFDPVAAARTYLWNYENKTIERTSPATITFLQKPSHGVLRLLTEADRGVLFSDTAGSVDPSDPSYVYLPQKGYVGKDKAVALVEIAGVKIKVIYYFQAIDGGVGDINHWCGKRGYQWKISSNNNGVIMGDGPRFQKSRRWRDGGGYLNPAGSLGNRGLSLISPLIGK